MRETLAAVVAFAVLAAACDARTDAPAPAAQKAASAAAPAATTPAPARPPAATSTQERKASEPVKVAKAHRAGKATARAGKKASGTDVAAEPSAPAVKLSQSPPSSY
jgi:hypothetical protein